MKKSTRTYQAKPGEVERRWHIVDAEGKTLGRLATEVALILRGKRKPEFTPHVDAGDFVVVINAGKIHLTGSKPDRKIYFTHSMWPGGWKKIKAGEMLAKNPSRMLRLAVRGMLPKNRLSDKLITKLKIYSGSDHPHGAQKATPLEV